MSSGPYKQLRSSGFTLVELMATLAVLLVILLIAVPGLRAMYQTSKVRSAQSELVSALVLARSEAVRRNLRMMVVANADDFSKGWTVVVGEAPGPLPPGAQVVRAFPDISAAVLIDMSVVGIGTKPDRVFFDRRGFLSDANPAPGSSILFKVCGASDTSKGYLITLPAVGLADVSEVACP